MKILYGVQGTGNGHLTRARRMCKHFTAAGLDVDYLFSGRAREKYFDMGGFGDWRCCNGLTFTVEKGSIRPLATVINAKPLQLLKDIRNLPLENYDLIITDFEPITAWAAKLNKRPCLGVGHQYAFDYPIPMAGDNPVTRTIMRRFAPVSHSVGLHWYHFQQPILPPIVDTHEDAVNVEADKIIVYLPFEQPEVISQLLAGFNGYHFLFYGSFERQETAGNVTYNPVSREGFQRDLARSGGVICNAGFELASEAICLGKKLLVKPVHGQMEQLSNALALEKLELGVAANQLTRDIISRWLDHFSPKQVVYPDVAEYIVQWIQRGDLDNQEQLVTELWQATDAKGLQTFQPYRPGQKQPAPGAANV